MFLVTIRFTGGLLKGLTYTSIETFKRAVGRHVRKPLGGSPYLVVSCEALP